MYERILVPVDGSDPATAAVDRALALAGPLDATLSLLAVVEPTTLPMAEKLPSNPTRAALDEQSTETLEYAESAAADAGVDCLTSVESGTPHEEIGAHTDDEDVDLIAMGTHGRTGLDRLLLGSTTERTLRTSDAPVLTTRERDRQWDIDEVLVPTDGSEPASVAVDHALDLASACDATVHALSVVDAQALAATYHTGGGLSTVVESLKEQREHDVEAVRDSAVERGLDHRTAVLEGLPERTVPSYAGDQGVDLIAMGTHGRTGLKRAFMGSVAERTIRTSTAPVLAVPDGSEHSG